MRKHLIMLTLICSSIELLAQKPLIDSTQYEKWTSIGDASISNDGRFVSYNTINIANQKTQKVIVQTIKGDWKKEYLETKTDVQFTADSKFGVFISSTDSLQILDLKKRLTKSIPNVLRYSIPSGGSGDWLLYNSKKEGNQTSTLMNLLTGKETLLPKSSYAEFSKDGNSLVLCEYTGEHQILEWMDLLNAKTTLVKKSNFFEEIRTDFDHNQLVFKIQDSIFYYKKGLSEPILLVDKSHSKFNTFIIGSLLNFSKDGKRLFFNFSKPEPDIVKPNSDVLSIWSYLDINIQPEQEYWLNQIKNVTYTAITELSNHTTIVLQQYENEVLNTLGCSNFCLAVRRTDEGFGQEVWKSTYGVANYLINITNGKRIQLDSLCNGKLKYLSISPDEKYIVFYSQQDKNYFSYNISSGKLINLTCQISTSWDDIVESDLVGNPKPRWVAGWMNNNDAIAIYDSHDIWEFSLNGQHLPVNITNGFGMKNHIVFNLKKDQDKLPLLKKNENTILIAFNQCNKNNGFFCKKIDQAGNPIRLTMGSYLYSLKESPYIHLKQSTEFGFLKAKNAEQYLVRRMSADEAPNYFVTKDLKSYRRLTELNPQKEYNWYTTELHTWNSLDGRKLQGILYKPENFDENKKYPVIFFYYERKTDGLNAFLYPEFSTGSLDVPTYVSNGYLVFSPDIYYTIGNPMESTYDALVSAAQYVSTLKYVDPRKIGLQGHSFGGIQTNYLITKTNLFAAACSASGIGDWVSGYNSLGGSFKEGFSGSLQYVYESGQLRMGDSLWANLKSYINNSPVFSADQVTTPLLLMHTINDDVCPFQNITQFFLSLRRLGKRAWLLAYPKGSHTLSGKEAEDFTVRMQQFFDHYLKGKPAPIWMTKGIHASRKGIDSGLELDTVIKTPGPGILKPQEQHKVDSLMLRKQNWIRQK